LDSIQGALTINGLAGSNAITFSDQGTAAARHYVLPGTGRARTGGARISWTNIQPLVLCGGGRNGLYIQSTPPASNWSVYAGAGNDIVAISGLTATLDSIRGALTLDTQAGQLAHSGASGGRTGPHPRGRSRDGGAPVLCGRDPHGPRGRLGH